MGLPKPLGNYTVAFGDFELRRIDEVSGASTGGQYAPPFRVFYPTDAKQPSALQQLGSRSWLMNLHYTWGYCCTVIAPTTTFRRMFLWVMASTIHAAVWPWSALYAGVGKPLLASSAEEDEPRLPVIVFSHGLWACRTTYSAFCCDLASHGYVVVAIEHLDGSAQMARYIDLEGKKRWLPYTYRTTPPSQISFDDRAPQLNARSEEIKLVVDILEKLDHGLLVQGSNTITGNTKLDVSFLLHRLDLGRLAVAGHSFGGATAVVVSGLDSRFKCCLGMDVWWEPVQNEKVNFESSSSKVPMILLNTENFDWKTLREARSVFLNQRLASSSSENPLVTDMFTIKGTIHQDQSDLPLIFKCFAKKMGLTGSVAPATVKNVNNRACLGFLQQHLLTPDTSIPHPVVLVEADEEYLVHGNGQHENHEESNLDESNHVESTLAESNHVESNLDESKHVESNLDASI